MVNVYPRYPSLPEVFGPEGRAEWERRYPELVLEYYRVFGAVVGRRGGRVQGVRGGVVANTQFDSRDGCRSEVLQVVCQAESSDMSQQFESNSETKGISDGSLEGVQTKESVIVRGKHYEKNRLAKQARRLARSAVGGSGNLVASSCVEDSRKKFIDLEVAELKLKREKEQLAITCAFRERQEQQVEISRLFRLKQERIEKDVVTIAARLDTGRNVKQEEDKLDSEYKAVRAERERYQLEISRLKAEREKCQLEISQVFRKRQERIECDAESIADRKRLAAVAHSDIMVMRAETMKINRDKRNERLAEVERKENWREGATGIPSVQGSVKTASSSGSVSVDSSVSQRCSGSSGSSSLSRVSLVDCVVDDISTVAREKNLDRSKYTPAQQAYIEMKRDDLIVYNCEPGTWLGDVQVVNRVNGSSSSSSCVSAGRVVDDISTVAKGKNSDRTVKRVNHSVGVVKHVVPVVKVTARDALKGLLK